MSRRQKTPPTDKGRYDDIRISSSDYSAYIVRCWGKVRFAPQIVFSNGIQHYIQETGGSSGGKGGGGTRPGSGGTVREHFYQTTIGLLACANQINSFYRIWADADSIYYEGTGGGGSTPSDGFYEAENTDLSGGAHSVADAGCSNGYIVQGVGLGGAIAFDFSSGAESSMLPGDDSPTLIPLSLVTFYYKSSGDKTAILTPDGGVGKSVVFTDTGGALASQTVLFHGHIGGLTISNASAACPDFDALSISYSYSDSGGGGGGGGIEYVAATGAVNPKIKYPADKDNAQSFYNYKPEKNADGSYTAQTPLPSQSFRFYTGTEDQMPDSAIKAWLDSRYGTGAGDERASAMRGLSYVVLENYNIPNGRLPNFTMEVDQGTTSVAQIVTDLYAESGIAASRLDLTQLGELTLEGLIVYQFTPAAEIIRKLETWFNFKMVDTGIIKKAVLEGGTSVLTIPAQDLRAHDAEEDMPEFDADITETDERVLPIEYHVSAMNPLLDYHNESQTAQLFASTSSKEIVEATFPFVAAPDEAKRVAETLLLKTHLEAKPFKFSTTAKYARLFPGDVIDLALKTRTYKLKIVKKRMALMGKIEFEAVPTTSFIFGDSQEQGVTQLAAHSDKMKTEALPSYPRNSRIVVIESEPLIREHQNELGVYLAVSGRGVGRWNGATVFREQADDFFEPLTKVDAPAKIGVCQNTLASFSGAGVDASHSSTIYFYDAVEIESVSQAEAEANPSLNLIRIGGEWIQFLTATVAALPDGSIYRSAWTISNLLRGRFGTNSSSPHAASETAVVATSALKWRRFETTEIGQTINLKAVTDGQAEEYAETISFVLQGKSIQPTIKRASYNLTYFDDLKTFTNTGAAAQVPFNLPPVREGYSVSFVVSEDVGIIINAHGSDLIYKRETVSTAGGNLQSTVRISTIRIEAVGGVWVVMNQTGTWSVN